MATWFSGTSRYQRILRRNAFIWCMLYLVVFTGLILRLVWLQVVKHSEWTALGDRYRYREATLPAPRGRLLDRNLNVLALDDQRPSLYADPTLCIYPWEDDDSGACSLFVARQLAPILGTPEATLLAQLRRQTEFVWVKRNLSPATISALRARALPGVEVRQDDYRYRLSINMAKVPPDTDIVTPLAAALNQPAADIRNQLGLTPPAQGEAAIAAPTPPTGTRYVRGLYQRQTRDDVQRLRLPGVAFERAEPNYSLGADPRLFQHGAAGLQAATTAGALAPVLGSSARAIERRLSFRPRFSWMKRSLSVGMYQQVQRLQGTVFVVEPGRVLAAPRDGQTPQQALEAAVDSLYDMLNEPRKAKAERRSFREVISRDEIRRHLQPDCPPGPLCMKLNDNGGPYLPIMRRLHAEPIPGVIYGLPGIAMQQELRRRYLFNSMAATTLGFVITNEKNRLQGAFGLEQELEPTLNGVDGFETKEIDARRRPIPNRSTRTEPVPGQDVILTLDKDIQLAAEEALGKAVQQTKAIGGQCVVMDPRTGEILALATQPTWDANAPGKSKLPLVNPAISHFYEPGSTFKTFTVLAALEEGLIHDGETITYCSGALGVGRRTIHEAHNAHGQVDAARLLEQSCNIGAALLAMKLGPKRFLSRCDSLGFGSPTGVGLSGESAGSLNRTNTIKAKITLANAGFGQSIAVTPLQMVAGYSAVANGGEWIQPHLVKAVLLRDGTQAPVQVPRHRVCSDETSRLLRGYLERVVTEGTGGTAAIPGYRVAGKTGTAQKAVPGGGYGSGKAIGSFIGFVPADKPRLTIIAIIDEPQGSHYGGVVAAPVFREVGERALHYLSVPPTESTGTPRPAAP